MKKILSTLHWQILIAMILGVVFGYTLNINPEYLNNSLVSGCYQLIVLLGTLFVRSLKMIMIPLIFTSIIIGITSIGNQKALGNLGLKTIAYYISTSLVAILIGLSVANIVKPGSNVSIPTNVADQAQVAKEKVVKAKAQIENSGSYEATDIFYEMVPDNLFNAFSQGQTLGIIFFAIIFGIAMNFTKGDNTRKLREVIDGVYQVILKITQVIIKLAPIGVLGLMAKNVQALGIDLFKDFAWYIFALTISLSTHFLIAIPLIILFFIKVNPKLHYKAMSTAMLTSFSTASSAATLPVTMKCVNENVKVSKKVSGFVLPMGATINMDGTALYECVGVLFIAQAMNFDLTIANQITIVFTALLVSIGAAGIPSAGTMMMFIVANAVGLNGPMVDSFIIAMLAIDRPLDMFRTTVNITSDSVGAAVIAKSEGEDLY